MSMLDELRDDAVWRAFLQYKIEKRHLSSKEQETLTAFVERKEYLEVTDRLAKEGYCFEPPVKILVNKSGTNKKRVVYSFSEKESMVLKVMSHLLYRYDELMSPCCYSFRRSQSAKDAIRRILQQKRLSKKYCFKADISNYFNSIPSEKLVEVLRENIADDTALIDFLAGLLLAGVAYDAGELKEEARGAMAGIPIAPFFANIYLLSMDQEFEEKGVAYFRYSDDILLFADSREEMEEYEQLLKNRLSEKGLVLNPEKVKVAEPGEPWDFLGFTYHQGNVDLSHVTKNKMKAKIKRKAHALYRWRTRKQVEFEPVAKTMIRIFNKKFYDETDEKRFTWSRWFFPVLTTDEGLKELDAYLIQYIRYLSSGRHYKGNYKISYEDIKRLGFRSLVNEYYKWKE